MCDWYRVSETETAGGHPTQWASLDEEGRGVTGIYLVGFVRVSGPDDRKMPRRVFFVGARRAQTQASALHALRRYDPMYRIVPRPQNDV
jgi:hypothetical protein